MGRFDGFCQCLAETALAWAKIMPDKDIENLVDLL